ncbi:MAG: phosphoglycolate phosphatase [Burkholderiales bacterium]
MPLAPQTCSKDFPLPLKAVLIDLDGTLLDTAPDLAGATNLTLSELGFPAVDARLIRGFIGGGIAVLLQRALTAALGSKPDDEIYRRSLPLFEKHYAALIPGQTRPFPGVLQGLQKLRAQGLRLACVTNKVERFTLPLLQATGLSKFFELVVSGDSLPRKKPDPLPLTHCCAHFHSAPHETLLIGDSPHDTDAARAAGCPVFCVPYGYGRDVRELDCDAIVATLKDAADLVIKA